ncbi:hypothetical protein BC937DRAFT_89798 [Endogone sp. FLAS-F59071]|nr:hypothetical protein BC937DRAFT_89798 [Endogone sp. FLAS-F59071]|eukprot:RUS22286.1 hypothetical protein BC937DRAFT_89798 [Endogone sp. FLAS-F59071]
MSIKRWDTQFSVDSPTLQYDIPFKSSNKQEDFNHHWMIQINRLKGVTLADLKDNLTKVLLENRNKAEDILEYVFMACDDPIGKFINVAAELQEKVFLGSLELADIDNIATLIWRKLLFTPPFDKGDEYSAVKGLKQYLVLETKVHPTTFAFRQIKKRIDKRNISLAKENENMIYAEQSVSFVVANRWNPFQREYSIEMLPINRFLTKDSHLLYKYYRLLMEEKSYAVNLELIQFYSLFLSDERLYGQALDVGVLDSTANCMKAFQRIANEMSETDKRIIYTKYYLRDPTLLRLAFFLENLTKGIISLDVNIAIFLIAVLAYDVAYMSAVWARASAYLALASSPGVSVSDIDASSINFTNSRIQDWTLCQLKDALLSLMTITIVGGFIARIILASVYGFAASNLFDNSANNSEYNNQSMIDSNKIFAASDLSNNSANNSEYNPEATSNDNDSSFNSDEDMDLLTLIANEDEFWLAYFIFIKAKISVSTSNSLLKGFKNGQIAMRAGFLPHKIPITLNFSHSKPLLWVTLTELAAQGPRQTSRRTAA